MKITIIGTGYVGLVSGVCFAEFGFDVTCVDKDADKIENLKQGIIPIYEIGLTELIQKNKERLTFTTNTKKAVENSDVVFIAVGTPDGEDGKADLSFVFSVAEEISDFINDYKVIVMKSTVPVGTGRKIHKIINKKTDNFDIASNPEFLKEGSAINDFLNPDRVVVGVDNDKAKEIMARLYAPLSNKEVPVLFTNIETSELIKYAANCFLAAKISFINEIADICEKAGADVERVAEGMGLDKRIGSNFLKPGPGCGGSCFPKDTIALVQTARELGTPIETIEAVVKVNNKRKKHMAEKVISACDGIVKDKKIAILGLTFKANTDDIRESASLTIISKLLEEGAEIQAFDPEGMKETKQVFPDIKYCENAYNAMTGADVVVIVTEWDEFKGLDLEKAKELVKIPTIVDLRNLYERKDVEQYGFKYICIGRPAQ